MDCTGLEKTEHLASCSGLRRRNFLESDSYTRVANGGDEIMLLGELVNRSVSLGGGVSKRRPNPVKLVLKNYAELSQDEAVCNVIAESVDSAD